jgi:hypothetical protein
MDECAFASSRFNGDHHVCAFPCAAPCHAGTRPPAQTDRVSLERGPSQLPTARTAATPTATSVSNATTPPWTSGCAKVDSTAGA